MAAAVITAVCSTVVTMVLSSTIGGALVKTCYECYLARYPDVARPDLRQDYAAMLEKYHEHGVISDAAYEKMIHRF
jgi:hypothetical protein